MPTVSPLTGSIGAEVTDIDLGQPLPDDLAADLKAALAQHGVLFFPGQNMDLETQKAFTLSFGPMAELPYVKPMDEHPEVIEVRREANEAGGVFGGDWHTDFSFLRQPPAGSVLNAVEVPPHGGDTVWASQVLAWEALPEPLKGLLEGRKAVHVGKPYGVKWSPPVETRSGASMTMARGDPTADEERLHPAVLRHPATGRKMLFLNPTYVSRLDGMSEDESRPILDAVQKHTTRPEFCCRYRWRKGAVAVWDNFATQHYAINDYRRFSRLMYRTTFAGPSPEEMAV